ncbi:MAG: sigma factor-like helix-turn-helix DNA-binding protein [Patescibacteria group bacterium]
MNDQNSILDKIITSKQTEDVSQFNPQDKVSSFLKLVSDKEGDILRRRYGLNGKREETLEEIGGIYGVTRERIRQVENLTLQKIKQAKEFNGLIQTVEGIISSFLHQHGGIMEEEYLFWKILSFCGDSEINRKSLSFILTRLLSDKFKKIKSDTIKPSWLLKSQNLDLLNKTHEALQKIFENENKPLGQDEILAKFKLTEIYKAESQWLKDEVVISYLKTFAKVSSNPFDEYGLISWGSITPKRINDKIYLILKKNGQPMHFTKIAEMVNKASFDDKKAYPPTVHNELILNDRYVLVGRGIYALKEWGYKPGVVIDVLTEILKSESRPLTRDEVIKKVMEKRMVKKNTILLALTNKERFKKLTDGTYTLNNPQ